MTIKAAPTTLLGWLLLVLSGCASSVPAPRPAPAVEAAQLSPAQTELEKDMVVLPIAVSHDQPRLLVDVGDAQPASFLIDTGANGVVLSRHVVSRAALQTRRPQRLVATDATGQSLRGLEVARIPQLQLGGATFGAFDALVLEDEYLTQVGGLRGIFGSALFADCVMTLDYAAQALILQHSLNTQPDEKNLIPSWFDELGHPYIMVHLAGQPYWAQLDTGFNGGLELPATVAQGLAFRHGPVTADQTRSLFAGGRSQLGRVTGQLRIGSHIVTDPVVAVDERASTVTIGSQLLKHFVVNIDWRRKMIWLTRTNTEAIEMGSEVRLGFALYRRGYSVLVREVTAGSEAERAGLKQGDAIIAINGRPATEISLAFSDSLVEQAEPMVVQVYRGGQPLKLTVPVTVLVP